MRQGGRGATAKVEMPKNTTEADLELELEEFPVIGGLRPAIVQSVEQKSAKIYVKNLGSVTLPWEKMAWARRELPDCWLLSELPVPTLARRAWARRR